MTSTTEEMDISLLGPEQTSSPRGRAHEPGHSVRWVLPARTRSSACAGQGQVQRESAVRWSQAGRGSLDWEPLKGHRVVPSASKYQR